MKSLEQFILETVANLVEGVNTAKTYVKSGKLTQAQFDQLVSIDPSKKYVDWLAVQFVKSGIDVFDTTVKDVLAKYDDLYSRKIIKNPINDIKSVSDMKSLVDSNKDSVSKREVKNQSIGTDVKIKGLKEGEDYDILLNNDRFVAYGIYNKQASITIGKDSAWCTTIDDCNSSHWDSYVGGGKRFIYVVDKVNKTNHVSNSKGSPIRLDRKGTHSNDTWAIYLNDETDEITVVDKGDNNTNVRNPYFKKNIGLGEKKIRELFSNHKVEAKLTKSKLIRIIKESPVDADLNHLDVSGITDMSSLFEDSKFNGDISEWDVSNVTDMIGMFSESKFNGDISKWDVSNVKDMRLMFRGSQFNGDISGWDVSRVTYMDAMFRGSKFNGDISKWNVSKVRYMNGMFDQSKFNGDISKWDVSKVTDMGWMFKDSPLESKYGTNGEKLKQ